MLPALFGPLVEGLSEALSVNLGRSVGPLLTMITLMRDMSDPKIQPLTDFRLRQPCLFGVYCPVRPSRSNLVL